MEEISSNNILEELEVTVTTTSRSSGLGHRNTADWIDLDRVLTSSGAFPTLRWVTFELKVHQIYPGQRKNSLEFLPSDLTEQRFPRLLADTTINFVYRETNVRFGDSK